jgi:hypothetical protein
VPDNRRLTHVETALTRQNDSRVWPNFYSTAHHPTTRLHNFYLANLPITCVCSNFFNKAWQARGLLMMPYSQKSRLLDMLSTKSGPKNTQRLMTRPFKEGYLKITPRLWLWHDYVACRASRPRIEKEVVFFILYFLW